jgi:endonuclease G
MHYVILSILLLTLTACSQIRPEYPSSDSPSRQIPPSGKLLQLNYEGFTVWLDCEKRGAMKFQYNAQHDTGNAARAKNFKLDPNVPVECQQTSTKGYGHGYDRGHQVPANHLDYSPEAIKGLINQKNGLFHDTPGALGISDLQPKYRFQIRQ